MASGKDSRTKVVLARKLEKQGLGNSPESFIVIRMMFDYWCDTSVLGLTEPRRHYKGLQDIKYYIPVPITLNMTPKHSTRPKLLKIIINLDR